MVDNVTSEKRSWIMSKVQSKNTRPELAVRSILHRLGLRFRLDGRSFPGNPDIVLAKYRALVFVNGCFWHQHTGCSRATIPKTNREFWQNKFRSNKLRDRRNMRQAKKLGWKTVVVWECQLKDTEALKKRLIQEIKNEP